MSETPNSPRDNPDMPRDPTGDAGLPYDSTLPTPPRRRGGALLWLLLLVALLLLGWWWFTQREVSGPLPGELGTPATTAEPAVTETQQKAAVVERERKAAQAKARKVAKPAVPKTTDARPIAGQNPAPDYPREALRRGVAGTVLLHVDVAADGTATNVDFAHRSGSAELDRAAMNAVRKWHFTPAKRNGKAVDSSVTVPVEFVLPKN